MTAIFTSTFSSIQRILSWVPHFPDRATPPQTLQISPTDLLESLPDFSRDFRINPLCKRVSEESETWAMENIGMSPSHIMKTALTGDTRSSLDKDEEGEMLDLKTGLLASLCLANSDLTQLRLGSDFLAWVWLLDHYLRLSGRDERINCIEENTRLTEDEPGSTEVFTVGFPKGIQNVLRRLERSPEASYTYDRFRIAIRDYLQFLLEHFQEQSGTRTLRSTKDHVEQHRQRSWHTPLFILIEYTYGLKSLPQEPQRHSTKSLMRNARDSAAEVIVYALDIYACAGALSQNKLQTLSPLNIITLLAQEQNLSTLSAIAHAKELFSDRLRAFIVLQDQLLRERSGSGNSTNMDASTDVAIYARALGDCVRGVMYWAFESDVFFGRNGGQATLVVDPENDGNGNELQDEVVAG